MSEFDHIFWPSWMPIGHTWPPAAHIAAVFVVLVGLLTLIVVPVSVAGSRRRRRAEAMAAGRRIDLSDDDAAAAAALGRALALDEFREDRMNLIFQVWGDQPNVADMDELIRRTADDLRDEWASREWSIPRTEKFCDRYEYPLSTLLDEYRLKSLLLAAGLSGTSPEGKRVYPALVEISETGGGMCAVFSGCPSVSLDSWLAAAPYLTSALDAPKSTVRAGDDGEIVLTLNDRPAKPTNGPDRRAVHHIPRRQLETGIPETMRATAPADAPLHMTDPEADDAHTTILPIDVDVVSEHLDGEPLQIASTAFLGWDDGSSPANPRVGRSRA